MGTVAVISPGPNTPCGAWAILAESTPLRRWRHPAKSHLLLPIAAACCRLLPVATASVLHAGSAQTDIADRVALPGPLPRQLEAGLADVGGVRDRRQAVDPTHCVAPQPSAGHGPQRRPLRLAGPEPFAQTPGQPRNARRDLLGLLQDFIGHGAAQGAGLLSAKGSVLPRRTSKLANLWPFCPAPQTCFSSARQARPDGDSQVKRSARPGSLLKAPDLGLPRKRISKSLQSVKFLPRTRLVA
jgi:hypothetical protein